MPDLLRPLANEHQQLIVNLLGDARGGGELGHLVRHVLGDGHEVEVLPAVLHAHLHRDEREHLPVGRALLHDLELQSLDAILAVSRKVGIHQIAHVHVHAPVGLAVQMRARGLRGVVSFRVVASGERRWAWVSDRRVRSRDDRERIARSTDASCPRSAANASRLEPFSFRETDAACPSEATTRLGFGTRRVCSRGDARRRVGMRGRPGSVGVEREQIPPAESRDARGLRVVVPSPPGCTRGSRTCPKRNPS